MKYYIVAGERSGDLHGGNLIQALKLVDTESEFRGFGGDYMEENGMQLSMHFRNLAFMGFLEVVKNLSKISKYLKFCKNDILEYQPDVVILIDYGGFNLKIASFLRKNNIKVFYYISPKVWAWNQNRAKNIKKLVDRMFVILPFEKEFYRKFDWEVDYVGNPVLDAIKKHKIESLNLKNNSKEIVAVLPGSRYQEVVNVLEGIKNIISSFDDVHFVIAAVDNLDQGIYNDLLNHPNVELVFGRTYDLLSMSKAAIVTSGTATLETALWKIPQVVIYKTSKISYLIAKSLIRVDYISLVNLIADKPVVKELIQNDYNDENLSYELNLILKDKVSRDRIIEEYDTIEATLNIGSASTNAAQLMIQYLKEE
jgi:lipid-A-disaccharide synthase